MHHPQCGNCGYDLTGAESNRCPECGLLFVEAGVKLRRSTAGRRRRTRWIVVTSLVAIVGIGAGGATLAYLRAEAAQALAQAQQKAALARQLASQAKIEARMARTKASIERLRQTYEQMDMPKDGIDAEKSGKQGPFYLIPNAPADILKTKRPRADERAKLTVPTWLKWYYHELKESHSTSETQPASAPADRESIIEESSSIQNIYLAPADDAVMAAYRYVVEHKLPDRRDIWTQFDGAVRESDYSQPERDFEASIDDLLDVRDSLE